MQYVRSMEANMEDDNETFEECFCDGDWKLDHIPDVSECRSMLRAFEKDVFYPKVFHVNDHGNVDLLSIGWNGAKIIKSWV